MKLLYKIQNHLIERIKVYVWDYKSIEGFNSGIKIAECYEPTYLTLKNNNLLIGAKGYEVGLNELDLFKLAELLRFCIKTQRNKY